jgi:hypothetical protein
MGIGLVGAIGRKARERAARQIPPDIIRVNEAPAAARGFNENFRASAQRRDDARFPGRASPEDDVLRYYFGGGGTAEYGAGHDGGGENSRAGSARHRHPLLFPVPAALQAEDRQHKVFSSEVDTGSREENTIEQRPFSRKLLKKAPGCASAVLSGRQAG